MAIAGKVAITLSTENGGAWSSDVTYDRLVAVKHNNNLYISRKTVANVEPPNNEFWFLALEGFGGDDVEAMIQQINALNVAIEEILDGTAQVGNAKNLDGHGAEYFANKEDLANIELDDAKTLEGHGSDYFAKTTDIFDLEENLNVERQRINNLVGNTGEQTEGNAELIDIRVGADGKVYETAGESVRGQISELKNYLLGDDIILSYNLFDKESVIFGKSVKPTGEIYDIENNWISERIKVEPNIVYYIWGNACIYSASGECLGYHSINDAGLYTMPANASYMICTQANNLIDNYYVNKYASHGKDTFRKRSYIDAKLNGLSVKKNGGGDYTSLTKAMWDNVGKGLTIYVDAGEYDLLSEYPAYFGSDVFSDSKFDSDENPIEHQEWYEGLPIKDTKVFCSPNSVVKFNYDGSNEGLELWFSPFKFSGNGGELHGGQIICSNCRYAIHDDCYGTNKDRRITDGVYIYYRSSRNVAIGGGLGKSSSVEVKNCYVDSGNVGYGIWYHNATLADAQSFVSIHDNYATASIEVQTLGPSTLISKALVSNNKCHAVNKIENSEVDNFELVEWNNVTN